MSSERFPSEVLSQALADAVGGRRVRAAVFTTYSFDPGFFELNVLPLLFDQSFSQVDKVRRIQLEDALREVEELAVYYDRRALAQDAEPAQLDYRRLDVSRGTGVFHPKLVLLLVETPPEPDAEDDSPTESLVVGVQSANLTRAGWWESVECAHFEEIPSLAVSEERIPFRQDLLSLLRQVRRSAPEDESHAALDRIVGFLKGETQTARYAHARHGDVWYTRIFCGQDRQGFSEWLASLGLARRDWNLEIVSPYFDAAGAGPLAELVETLGPRETRVLLPREIDGSALVRRETYDAVAELARWAEPPRALVRRGRDDTSQKLPDRRVHAKLYRLWHRDGRDLLVVGSVNLTSPAHQHWQAGNLEAAFLVDVSAQRFPRRWWLEPLDADREPTEFAEENPSETEGLDAAPIALSLRFDWETRRLAYRLAEGGGAFRLEETSGAALARVDTPVSGAWTELPEAVGERMSDVLRSTSFLRVVHAGGSWRVLVREESMGHRPSLLTELTPEEILEYWALLSPEQRAAFLEARLGMEAELEGLAVTRRDALRAHGTLFDRYAGIFHAFGCLERHMGEAVEEGRPREAVARLLGAKYDSLPLLLEKTLDSDADPTHKYVTFLCAQQVRDRAAREHAEVLGAHPQPLAALDRLLARRGELRAAIGSSGDGALPDPEAFFGWYEAAFLGELGS